MQHSKMLKKNGLILAIALTAMFAGPVSAQELSLLRKIPADLMRYTGGARPDDDGMVTHNQNGFKSPEFQRGAMQYLIRGIVRGDRKAVEVGWRAIDATFREQTDEGKFGRDGGPHGGPSAVAFWLADLGQAMLLLRESELEPDYRNRIDELIPKIHKAAQWLAQPKYQERLATDDAEAPNRLFFDALAYGLSGRLAGDDALIGTGRRFVDLAMQKYRAEDGVFLEKGGHDSSYQAVAALKLQIWATYFPDDAFGPIIDRAVAWEIARIKPDGQVDATGNTRTGLGQEQWMGREKDVNLSEVTYCLLYYYARTGDCAAFDAAKRIVAMRKNGAPPRPAQPACCKTITP